MKIIKKHYLLIALVAIIATIAITSCGNNQNSITYQSEYINTDSIYNSAKSIKDSILAAGNVADRISPYSITK